MQWNADIEREVTHSFHNLCNMADYKECIGCSIKTLQRVALAVEIIFSINGNLYVFHIRHIKNKLILDLSRYI